MKIIIIAFCIFVVVAAGDLDQVREHFRKLVAECKGPVGANEVDVYNFYHRFTPESHAGKCLIACVNKKNKIQDENGKIDPETAKDAAREILKSLENVNDIMREKLLRIYYTCIDEGIDDPDECEVAEHWFICYSRGLRLDDLTKILTDVNL